MGGLNSVSSNIQGLTNALTKSQVAASLKRSSTTALPPPPRYSLHIWDDVGPAGSDALQGYPGSVVFRLAPNSISFSQPVRADVAMDLLGAPVVVDGGLGIARCTIRGSYGVFSQKDPQFQAWGGRPKFSEESPGFSNMREVREFFLAWADLNKQRALDGLPLLRLVFSVRDGAWSEWRLWQWWVIPTELPTEERSSGRPFEWAYSVSFWCLDMVHAPAADTLPGPTTTQKASEKVSGLQAALAGYRDLSANATDLANQLSNLRASLDGLRSQAIAEVRGVSDTIRRAASAVNGILAATNPATFRADTQEAYRGTLKDTRIMLGNLKTWNTTLAGARPGSARVAPSVPPGGTLQQMAVRSKGSMDSWPSLAAANGLRYPFLQV